MNIVLYDYAFEQNKPGISGLSDLIWNWAKNLVALGEEVHIVAPYPVGTQPPQGSIVHTFELPPINYRNIIGHLLIAQRGWKEISKLGEVDIIHVPEYLSTGVFLMNDRHAPVVMTIPGNIYNRVKYGNPYDWSMTQVLKVCARITARRAARIIVTSKEMEWWWQKTGASLSQLILIPHGIDTDVFHPIPSARKTLGIHPDKPVILFVGRLSAEKGLETLLHAFIKVLGKFPECELCLIGEGKYKENIKQFSSQLGVMENIKIIGWIDQPILPVYYSAANITVLPSFSEGMPRTMLEAMACASPFVGSRITGIMDYIDDGKTGFLFDPGDSAGLAEKLTQILDNPNNSKEIGFNGREYIKKNFTWLAIEKQIRECVYQKIAHRVTRG